MKKKYIKILSNLPYDAHTRGSLEQAGILPVHNLYAFKLTVAIRREVKENRHFYMTFPTYSETLHRLTHEVKTRGK